jgi:hypothetical protein
MQPAAAPRAFARVPAAPLAAAGRAARSTPLCLLMLRSLALSVPMAPQRNGTP